MEYFIILYLLTHKYYMIYKGYVLKHPVTNEIRYVGITSKELEKRLKGHIADTRDEARKK